MFSLWWRLIAAIDNSGAGAILGYVEPPKLKLKLAWFSYNFCDS